MSISKCCKFALVSAVFFAAMPLSVPAQDKDAKPADKPADSCGSACAKRRIFGHGALDQTRLANDSL